MGKHSKLLVLIAICALVAVLVIIGQKTGGNQQNIGGVQMPQNYIYCGSKTGGNPLGFDSFPWRANYYIAYTSGQSLEKDIITVLKAEGYDYNAGEKFLSSNIANGTYAWEEHHISLRKGFGNKLHVVYSNNENLLPKNSKCAGAEGSPLYISITI